MDKNLCISPMSAGEIELLRSVALQAYADHYLHLWYDGGEWYMEKSFCTQQLEKELQDGNARFFLIYDQQVAVGFLKLNIDAPLQDVPGVDALELERIYLTKAASGRGIGSAVVAFVFETAAKLQKKTVWLKVMDSSTKVIAFYTQQGFSICGTHLLTMEQMKAECRGMFVMKRDLRVDNF